MDLLTKQNEILSKNNDEMEKRNRRLKQVQKRRKSLGTIGSNPEFISDMYTKIIQLNTENKITQKNSWNLDLIDHMDHILSIEKENNEDLYNFQKASCTLDASVKIYAHRVDETWNSSFKVLENISMKQEPNEPQDEDVQDADDLDDIVHEKVKRAEKVKTLETKLGNINGKSMDFNSGVNPLFVQASQMFDHSGPKGLLLAVLPVQNGCTLRLNSIEKGRNETPNDSASGYCNDSLRKLVHSCNRSSKNMELCSSLEMLYAKFPHQQHEVFQKHHYETVVLQEIDQHESDVLNEVQPNDDDAYNDDTAGLPPIDENDVWSDEGSIAEIPTEIQEQNNIVDRLYKDEKQSFTQMHHIVEKSMEAQSGTDYTFFDPNVVHEYCGDNTQWQFQKPIPRKPRAQTTKKQSRNTPIPYLDPSLHLEDLASPIAKGSTLRSKAQQSKLKKEAGQLLLPQHFQFDTATLHHPFYPTNLSTTNLQTTPESTQPYTNDTSFQYDTNDAMYDDTPSESDELFTVPFEHVAKKMDMKKLQHKMWTSLSTQLNQGSVPFDRILEQVSEQNEMISMPYAFITLLHLTNEHELSLNDEGGKLEIHRRGQL